MAPVSPVPATRAIQHVWFTPAQFRQVYGTQEVPPLSAADDQEQWNVETGQSGELSIISKPIYLHNMQSMLPLRRYHADNIDSNYIRKATERLSQGL